MGSGLVRDESPMEFFREHLEKAMEHQQVATSSFTEYYLVNLLTSCVQADSLPGAEPGYDETPLALLYVRALESSRYERARLLRTTGDTALFVAGFFGDSLEGKLVDFDYYRAMGGRAYARLCYEEEPVVFGAEVFGELSERFCAFADLLAEVSEATQISSSQSIMRLYERWLQTGSRRAAAALAQRGIAPVRPTDGRPQ